MDDPLVDTLQAHAMRMAAELTHRVMHEIPAYQVLPVAQLRQQMQRTVDVTIESLREHNIPSAVARAEEVVHMRQQQGFSTADQMHAMRLLTDVFQETLRRHLVGDPATLERAILRLNNVLAVVNSVMARLQLAVLMQPRERR